MGWVRSHTRRGAWFALMSLALQIVVSFGHVDLDGAVGPDHLALSGPHRAVLAKASQPGPSPVTGDDGYCPICASIFLVSTSFVSEPPQLPVPDGFERIRHAVGIVCAVTIPLRVAFRSRAPPLA